MIAWRRIRATLVFGALSTVVWAAILLSIEAMSRLRRGDWSHFPLGEVLFFAATIGFGGGLLMALLFALIARRRGSDRIPLPHAALAGAVAGMVLLVLYAGLDALWLGQEGLFARTLWPGMAWCAGFGLATGTAIAAVARRGRLPPGAESAKLRSPDSD